MIAIYMMDILFNRKLSILTKTICYTHKLLSRNWKCATYNLLVCCALLKECIIQVITYKCAGGLKWRIGFGGPVGLGRLGLLSPADPGKGLVGVPIGLPFAPEGVPMGLGLDPEGVINSELGRELGRELGAEFGGVPVPARGRGPE